MNARMAVTLLAWSGYFLVWAAVTPQLWGWFRHGIPAQWRRWQVWAATAGIALQFVYWLMHGWPMYGPTYHWFDAFNN